MFEALLSNRTVSVLVEALPRILTAGLTMTITLPLVSFFFAMIIAVPVGLIVINLYEAGAFDDIIKDVKELAEGLNAYRKGE